MVAFNRDSAGWHLRAPPDAGFQRILPEIQDRARREFRGVRPGELEELVSEVTDLAFQVFLYLAQRGKADIAYPKPLAISAIKQVRAARAHPQATLGR
jgi:hypothetical protein